MPPSRTVDIIVKNQTSKNFRNQKWDNCQSRFGKKPRPTKFIPSVLGRKPKLSTLGSPNILRLPGPPMITNRKLLGQFEFLDLAGAGERPLIDPDPVLGSLLR